MSIRFCVRAAALLIVGGGVLVAAGCDDEQQAGTSGSAQPAAAAADAIPAGLIVAEAPAGATGIADARKAGEGDEVIVRGRIAGRAAPFTEGRAQFQLVDLLVRSCAENPGDACETPWDMCCEEPKQIADNSVTVQVVGPDGKPLKAGLKGVGGLKPLGEVSVKGTVHKSPDGKAVTVNATQVYVKQG